MNFARLLARQVGLATVFGMAAFSGQAGAQALDDGGASTYLKLDNADSRNYFVRFGYTYIKPNNKAGKVYDVTGPAVGYQQALTLVQQGKLIGNGVTCTPNGTSGAATPPYRWGPTGAAGSLCRTFGVEAQQLDASMQADNISGLGIPPILSSEAVGAGSFTIQAGLYLDDDHKWTAEPYVFGVPFQNKVYVTGNNSLSGQLGITTQQLPLTLVVNRYFGEKAAILRPSLGFGATYAIFFNTHATSALNEYSGGPTDVKIKNAFGYGPFAGVQVKLADRWHLSAQVGYMKLKTSALLTTRDTKLTDGTTFGAVVMDTANLANDPTSPYYNTAQTLCGMICDQSLASYANTVKFMKAIQDANGGNLGTFTRKQDVSLDPYVLSLSVGYEF